MGRRPIDCEASDRSDVCGPSGGAPQSAVGPVQVQFSGARWEPRPLLGKCAMRVLDEAEENRPPKRHRNRRDAVGIRCWSGRGVGQRIRRRLEGRRWISEIHDASSLFFFALWKKLCRSEYFREWPWGRRSMPRRATSVSPNPTSRSIPGTPLCRATGPRDSSGGSDPIVGATCARAEGRCSKMRHNIGCGVVVSHLTQ